MIPPTGNHILTAKGDEEKVAAWEQKVMLANQKSENAQKRFISAKSLRSMAEGKGDSFGLSVMVDHCGENFKSLVKV